MSIPYVENGRTKQKLRTQTALVDAARALIERGIAPTVEQAAAEASISRTTAYRYFPNQRDLLVAAYPHIEARSLLGDGAPADAFERLELVVDEYLRMTVENERALRTAFVVSLDADEEHRRELVLRRGRTVGWIKDALAPLRDRMSAKDIEHVAQAIRAAAGIEALIWLCDVANLSREDAVNLMKWSARALLQAAIDDRPKKIRRRSKTLSRSG